MMNRAYSLLTLKAVDEEKRILKGIATTPTADLCDDIVEPKGAEFSLPIPFLWQHDSERPVGHVTKANVTKDGIQVEIQLQKIDEPGTVKDRLDAAWQDIKLGLVRGLSIGFQPVETSRIEGSFGTRFLRWIWLELSGVTVAANSDCSIQTIKAIDSTAQRAATGHKLQGAAIRSIDAALLAASGHKQGGSERTVKAGVTAPKSTPVVTAKEAKTMTKKTTAEQISAFEATRQAKAARMQELMDASAEKGETLDEAATQEYDGLKDDVKAVDAHLVRLREQEQMNKASAVEVKGATSDEGSRSRSNSEARETVRVQVRGGNVPKGIGFVRLLAAKTNAYLSKGQFSPLDFVKSRPQWQSETPEVEQCLKAAVSAGTTTDSSWAGPLVQYQNLASEFVEYLRPLTIIGRIPGFRHVPFKVKFPRQTGAAVAGWVGESKPKPATSLSFDSITLDQLKVAGIVPISMELVRLSSPSAETIVRDDLAAAVAQLIDHDFLDPEKAAVSNVSPASITNGVTSVGATGAAYSNLKADVKSVMELFRVANITPDVVAMNQRAALALSLMETSLGNPQFPGLTMNGGPFLGMTAIVGNNLDYTEDSPQEGDNLIFLRASEIALADEGGIEIDVSTEASIEMSTAPTDPVTSSTVLVSLWQQNLVGIRAERMINWVKRRSAAVQYISAAKYV
jgi:HK97 family phage major capsid protein/HK97 family phage prohead protease